MKSLEDRIKNTIWRVLHFLPDESSYAQRVYQGRGEQAKKIAEYKYDTLILNKGKIGLYKGIYQVKIRRSNEPPKEHL